MSKYHCELLFWSFAVVLTEHTIWLIIFAFDARALLRHNYDKLSRIFPCTLLIRNHMIFLVQFRINENLLIFSKTTNCAHPIIWCNFVSLWKNDYLYIFRRNLMQIKVLIEWIFFWCKNFSPFFGSGFDCKSTFHQESIWVPSINTTDSSCVLQTQPLVKYMTFIYS